MLVGQRTQAINALRDHATEFGIVAAKGERNVAALLADLAADTAIPALARTKLAEMGRRVANLDGKIEAWDRQSIWLEIDVLRWRAPGCIHVHYRVAGA